MQTSGRRRSLIAVLTLLFLFSGNQFAFSETESQTISEPLPAVDPGTPPTPPEDRSQSADRASKASKAAAGFQQMSCMLMMGMAMASGSAMAGMMAIQQCQQAQESEKNSEENESGKKVAGWQPGTPATMKLNDFKPPETPPADGSLLAGLNLNQKVESTPTSFEPIPAVAPLPASALAIDTPPAPAAPVVAKEETVAKVLIDETNIPGAIPSAKLGYNETGKSGEGVASSDGRATAMGTGRGADAADTALRAQVGSAQLEKIEGRLVQSPENGAAGGGSSDTPPSKNDEGSSLEAMMLALRGGAPAADVVSGTEDVLALSSGQASEEDFNIFQFASYRYKKAHSVDKRIRTQPVSAAKDKVAFLGK